MKLIWRDEIALKWTIMGIPRELRGKSGIMVPVFTTPASKRVMARLTFSPDSGGRKKVRVVRAYKSMFG